MVPKKYLINIFINKKRLLSICTCVVPVDDGEADAASVGSSLDFSKFANRSKANSKSSLSASTVNAAIRSVLIAQN